MTVDLTIRQGDTTPAFTATVTDQNGNAVNLTAATVTFLMRSLASSTLTTNAAMTITNATAGSVQYNWSTADTLAAGLYMAEVHCVLSGGGTYTYPNDGYLEIEIQESLSGASQQLITVSAAKDVLNIGSTDRSHDTKILRFVNGLRPLIETVCGPIVVTTFEEWHPGGNTSILLRRRPSTALGTSPVLTLEAISEYNGPIEWPLAIIQSPDLGQLYSAQLDSQLGQVVRRTAGGGVQAFPYGPQAVHVWYTAGQSTVPDNVTQAVSLLLQRYYQRTQQGGLATWAGRGEEAEPSGPALALPSAEEVRGMLMPMRRFPAFF